MKASELIDLARSDGARRTLLPLMAFAAGDAFGVAYEYLPHRIAVDERHLATRGDWPPGGVSDDTHLSLISIFAAEEREPEAAASRFLRDLRSALPRLRGLGPTTKAALGLDPGPSEDYAVVGHTEIGNTNGGMMRTSLLGLGFGRDRDAERRRLVGALTRATHPEPSAIECAVLCSMLYSRAFDQSAEPIAEQLRLELVAFRSPSAEVTGWLETLDEWGPPAQGVPLDPVETLAAVVWVVARAADPLDAYRLACELGGDTDTVAALAGGLVAARSSATLLDVPWLDDVLWAEIPEIVTAADRLSAMREAA